MSDHESIVDLLLAAAEGASPARADELKKASSKLQSFSRAPGTRKQADRIASVLTPAVVAALGQAFVDVRAEEIQNPPHPAIGNEYQWADYAFAALLVGAGSPELAEAAEPEIDKVVALLPKMDTSATEHLLYLSSLYPEVDAAVRVHAAASERLAQEPETDGERWAKELGLDMPLGYWSLAFDLPAVQDDRRLDAHIYAAVESFPGVKTTWRISIGTTGTNALGGTGLPAEYRGFAPGQYRRYFSGGEDFIEGSITPAQDPSELPRVLADLEAAHPELTFDRAALTATGGPGRLGTAARKKKLIAWLSTS